MLRILFAAYALFAIACSDPATGGGEPGGRTGDCAVDSHCASGVCIAGSCQEENNNPPVDAGPSGCAVDQDCLDGQSCSDDGRCVDPPRCARAADCPEGSTCQAGQCVEGPAPELALSADPNVVVVGFQAAGEVVQAQVAVVNSGQNALSVVEVTMDGSFTFAFDEFPQFPMRLVPGQQIQLSIVYTADDLEVDEATIWVRSDQDSLEPLAIPISSYTKNPEVPQDDPCLSVGPSTIDFGSVARGQHADRRFAMENCGSGAVTVSRIARGRTFFLPLPDSVQLQPAPNLPLTLLPGERQEVTVRYTARQATEIRGHWEVFSDDANNPRQRVNVRAQTPAPPIEEQGLHIRMSWDTDLNDIDMHLLQPGGQFFCPSDVYFSNRSPDWGQQGRHQDDPFLDRDDVDGHGPENINIEDPAPGVYTLLAHYYDDHEQFDTPMITFEVFSYGQLIGTYGPTGLASVGRTWDVVEVEWIGPRQAPVLRTLGQIGARAHGNCP